ncbi:MAG: D-2-hydroxyacid dehydrogenase [Vicinamibacterales bacterium]
MTILVLIHSPFRMWRIPLAHVERLQQDFPHHTILHARDVAEAGALVERADVAFSSQINPDHLRAAPRLRWIHSPAAGIAGMLSPEMLASAVVLTNSRGLAADTIAEHVLAVTLALFRRLPLAFARQAGKTWAQDEISAPPGNRMLRGAAVVLVGLGAIGSTTALRMHALGATVTGIRRRVSAPIPSGVSAVRPFEELHAVLPHADVLILAAPQTKLTRGLIGARELALMKPDGVLVNVSRGGLVDEEALAAALRAGRIASAALDVFHDEPLGPESPLWDVPNLLITPHTSGFRPDHWDAATDLFAENLRRFERGEELLNVVDKQAGY